MNIPDKIQIGGLTYKIKQFKQAHLEDEDGNEVDGRVIIEKQEIEFSFKPNNKKEYIELIFWHELTHLLFYYAGTGNSESWNNEQEVHSFSVLLYQVLKQL